MLVTLGSLAKRYALVVGQNAGGSSVENLHFAQSDAERFTDLLSRYGSFFPEDIVTLLHPDSSSLALALAKMVKATATSTNSQNDLFLLYFSGHADGLGLLLDSTHFAFSALREQFSPIAVGMRISIFDACQSGVVVSMKGGKRAPPLALFEEQNLHGEVIIASAAAQELAQESEELKSSIFSFHLMNGLRGSADILPDGKITLNEAYQYAYRKTIETSALTTGVVQHPVYRFAITGEGDIVLTDLTSHNGGIVFDRSCKGSFLVLSRNYSAIYADFYKQDETEQFVALVKGEYTIINARGGSDIKLFQCSIREKEPITLSANMFSSSLIETLRAKGKTQPDTEQVARAKKTVAIQPLRWGVAGAYSLALQAQEYGGAGREYFMSVGVIYGLAQSVAVLADCFLRFSEPSLGIEVGLQKGVAVAHARFVYGGGAGVDYTGKTSTSLRTAVAPLLYLQAGVELTSSSRNTLSILFPYRYIYHQMPIHYAGVALQWYF